MLFVLKGYLPMKIVESIQLQRLVYRLCLQMVFPSKKGFVDDVFFRLVANCIVESHIPSPWTWVVSKPIVTWCVWNES